MSDFALEEWEVPPGASVSENAPVISFGPMLWKGEEVMLSLKRISINAHAYLVLMRPHNEATNYVRLNSGFVDTMANKTVKSTKLSRLWKQTIEHEGSRGFGRMFYVGEEFCVQCQDEIGWTRNGSALICFRTPFDARAEPSASLFQWLQHEREKFNSEVRFAWKWSNGWGNEFYCETVPRWRELRQLMEWAAQYEELPEKSRWWIDHLHLPTEREKERRLLAWGRFLKSHFLPFEPFPEDAPFVSSNSSLLTPLT